MSRARDQLQELRELGVGGLAFRVKWEALLRTGLVERLEGAPPPLAPAEVPAAVELVSRLPFDAARVGAAVPMDEHARARLLAQARDACRGRIVAFGRWVADHGDPPDWHRNPVTGARWDPGVHWSRALRDEARAGDVKLAWEIGRFPHAYAMARAAAREPAGSEELAAALAVQIETFVRENPYGRGIHWGSSQEVVFRLMAWAFALCAFGPRSALGRVAPAFVQALAAGAAHTERHLDYARKAVYNNHLLSEAFGLVLAATLLPAARPADRWRRIGLAVLGEQADRQFYADGGYIQQSHNYERVALQVYLWAIALRRASRETVPAEWLGAVGRGVDFLHAQQNPGDGRLPNYGANDGALASPLSACDYSDFRPTLQAASLAARGERLYPPGPWDEEAAWLLGAASLDAPVRTRARVSVSFAPTGFHVLRGRDESTFSVLRCGTLRDRFSQIDMLHLDVWWRGENVLVDGGSYLYNGPAEWHAHFSRTASHNTVEVDGRDQMLHHRRFKNLYWTRADLLRFEDRSTHALVEGEHHGYARHAGRCTHRRAVLFVKDDLWVVVDRVAGEGSHAARVHWLAGPYPASFSGATATMSLETPRGPFAVSLRDVHGRPLSADVVTGREAPPRGWLSRYYGERQPVPSLAAEQAGVCPIVAVTLLSGLPVEVHVSGGEWSVEAADTRARFRITDGRLDEIRVEPA